MLFIKLVALTFVCQSYVITAEEITLSLSPTEQTIVAGQPVFETVTIKNNSREPVVLFNDRDELPIDVIGPHEKILRTPPVPPLLQKLVPGITMQPGSTESFELAVTELANASDPGDYVVTVRAPGLRVSGNCRVTVQPYDADRLGEWAKETVEEIIRRPVAEIGELVKALCSLRPDISEPYLCQLMTQSKAAAIPAVVDRLKELSTAPAAKCLITSIPTYSGLDKQYILAALETMQKNNSQLRDQIQAAIAEEQQKQQ